MLSRLLPGLALGLFLTSFVWAADDYCADADVDRRFDCLKALELKHSGNLEFDLMLAKEAGIRGEHGYAAIVLERVVNKHPGHAGARLDLVLASIEAGDLLTASRHLNILASIPNPPPAVARLLKTLAARLQPADRAFDREFRFKGSAGIGYDTNPNLGVFADAIDLVIDGAPVTLIPDQGFQPREDFFLGTSFSTEYLYSPSGLVRGTAYLRQYERLEEQSNYALVAQLFQGIGENRYIEAIVADFRTGDQLYLNRAGVGVRQKFAKCHCVDAGIGLDFLQGSEDSSRATRINLGLEARTTLGLARFQAHSRLAYSDQPDAPWGNTLGLDLGVDATVLISGWRASLGISSFVGRDDEVYSPLFPGEKRDLVRGSVRLGAAYRLADSWELFVDWTYSRQFSDIPLFEYKRQVSAVGLNFSF